MLDSSAAAKVKLCDTLLKELMLWAKVRDALRFFAVEKTAESRLVKSFGSIDKVLVSLGKVGFLGQPHNRLIAT